MMNKVCPQFGRRHSFWSLSLPIQIYLPASKFAYSICDSRCSPPKPHSIEEPRGWKMGKWISKKAHSFFSPTLWVHHTLSLFVCSRKKSRSSGKSFDWHISTQTNKQQVLKAFPCRFQLSSHFHCEIYIKTRSSTDSIYICNAIHKANLHFAYNFDPHKNTHCLLCMLTLRITDVI